MAQKTKKKSPQRSTRDRLTLKQQNLLEFLLDPANRLKTVTQICAEVGIDRGTYYDAFSKPLFAQRYEKLTTGLALRHAGQVMNAFVKEATRGSFPHGKAILEMAGIYQAKEVHELTGKDGGPIQVDYAGVIRDELTKVTAGAPKSLDEINQQYPLPPPPNGVRTVN